jgi:ElaB/YqjD/DUF883 family membrane-anchored ribosome-binding protein
MSTTETDSGRSFEEESRYEELREDREPKAIERQLDATRADMRATLEALERRFSFDRLVDLTVGRIRERGSEFAGNLTDVATHNPMPLLLTSIGLGWMILTSRRGMRESDTTSSSMPGSRERMGDIRERAAHASDKVHGAVESTRDTLRQAAESSRETLEQTVDSLRASASRAAEVTREQAESARERMDRVLLEQPLMLGAFGLAAGAIIGALLPTTEHEGRFLGEVRNKVSKNIAEKSRARFESARDHAATSSAPGGGSTEEEGASPGQQPASRPH